MMPLPVVQRHVWLPHIKWIGSVGSNCSWSSRDWWRGVAVNGREKKIIYWKNIPQKQLNKSGMVYLIPLIEKVHRCPIS